MLEVELRFDQLCSDASRGLNAHKSLERRESSSGPLLRATVRACDRGVKLVGRDDPDPRGKSRPGALVVTQGAMSDTNIFTCVVGLDAAAAEGRVCQWPSSQKVW